MKRLLCMVLDEDPDFGWREILPDLVSAVSWFFFGAGLVVLALSFFWR